MRKTMFIPVFAALLLFWNIMPALAQQTSTNAIDISADGVLEWHKQEQVYIARGNAVAKKADTSLAGDEIIAHYKNTAANGMEIWKIVAKGNVVVKTLQDVVYADKAEYLSKTQKAVLTGKVRIVRDKNTVTGNRAEVDFTKGTSKILTTQEAGGKKKRVQAVFYPEKKKDGE